MTDYRCSHCAPPHPGRHYADPCPGDRVLARLPLSPAVRLVTAPARDEAVRREFAGRGER